VLNDNGRSYAPTISQLTVSSTAPSVGDDFDDSDANFADKIADKLASTLTNIRLNPTYVRRQRRIEQFLRDLPAVGRQAERSVEAVKAAVREFLQPPGFFEALGVRYIGPIDGHDVEAVERALRSAEQRSTEGPILLHVVTQKGRGYSPAEDDDEKHLHDAPVFDPQSGPPKAVLTGYTQAFADALASMTVVMVDEADNNKELGRGKGNALLGHPLEAAMWLAKELKKDGITLRKGDLLSLGGFFPPQPVKSGMKVKMQYLGLPEDPSVSVEFD